MPGEFLLTWAEDVLHTALRRSPLLDDRPYEIFGQGSRVNNTDLDHASDIDLVLMLTEPTEAYGWDEFRDDVLTVLGESFTVRMGRRCLNVDDPDSLFGEMVDILVATEYHWFPQPGLPQSGLLRPGLPQPSFSAPGFLRPGAAHYEQGVFFRDREGRPIVNFPKQHRRNGDAKDLRTGGRFKQAVRAVKRARRADPEARALVPSYLVECLLYNVPDRVFLHAPDHRGAVGWLRRRLLDDPAWFTAMPCQNGINRIFGPGPDQWEPGAAARIIDVLHHL